MAPRIAAPRGVRELVLVAELATSGGVRVAVVDYNEIASEYDRRYELHVRPRLGAPG